MATAASKLLRAARSASLASRIAAAAASRAAAMGLRSSRAAALKASRSSRAAAAAMAPRSSRAAALMASRSSRAAAAAAARLSFGVIAPLLSCPTCGHTSAKPCDDASSRSLEHSSSDDYEHVPEDAKSPSDKDVESDEAVWAFYERWCKAFNKERDHAEMARRFKIFRYYAKYVHHFNTYLPPDPKEAAIYVRKRKKIAILLSKGEDVSDFDERYIPMELGEFADGGDPFIMESCKRLLLQLE